MPVVAQSGDDAMTAVARTYRKFGRLEARGRSAAYEVLAESVAGDAALVSFIASLPPDKRQPNLLFAAARYLLGAPADATLVIYHTSAMWYLPAERREQFAAAVRGLGATWLASEPPGVVPGTEGPARDGHTCVLAHDGHVIALTESHGTWLQWLP